MSNEAFVSELRVRFASFEPSEPDLPHVAVGEFTRWLLEKLQESKREFFDDVLPTVSEFLEEWATRDETIDLLQVSFLENLHRLGSDCALVIERLGPEMSELARQYEEKWGAICSEG